MSPTPQQHSRDYGPARKLAFSKDPEEVGQFFYKIRTKVFILTNEETKSIYLEMLKNEDYKTRHFMLLALPETLNTWSSPRKTHKFDRV